MVFYMDKEDNNKNSSLIKLKCAYCKYNCTIFKNKKLNSSYQNPIEEHAQLSAKCEIVKEKRKSADTNEQYLNQPTIHGKVIIIE